MDGSIFGLDHDANHLPLSRPLPQLFRQAIDRDSAR